MKIVSGAIVGIMTLAFGGSLAFAGKYNMAGCGLGASVFDKDTKGGQILAATTNGTSGNQTFGITSGTSGCTADGAVKTSKAEEVYVEVNFASLSQEMAAGGGEYLSSLGSLLGCKADAMPTLYSVSQSRYETIVPSENTTSTAMLSNLKAEMAANPVLAQCSAIEPAKKIAGKKTQKIAKK